jgi:hypothetical protein
MKGFEIKIATEATFERLNAHVKGFKKIDFVWGYQTAGIQVRGDKVEVFFPAIDETKEINVGLLNRMVGYVCHELGHLWFTDNGVWDNTAKGDKWIHSLINGLEDPRIEAKVIESGFAGNSRNLFTGLVNHIVGGEIPTDFRNIPFILAVEGRRLNGYSILAPQTYQQTPWAADIQWALDEAHVARNTARICTIAKELARRLADQQDQQDQQGNQGQQGEQGDQGDQGGQDGSQGQGEGQGKEEGQEGQEGANKGQGKGKGQGNGGVRSTEPADWINEEMEDHSPKIAMPIIEKPEFFKFNAL